MTAWKIAVGLLFAFVSSAHAAPLQVMSWNVENLFDTADDADNPQDDTYLPLAVKQQRGQAHIDHCNELNPGGGFFRDQCLQLDWSDAVYQTKLTRIIDVLFSMGSLPDILVLPETENKQVVDDLVAKLPAGSFPTVVALDSSDEPISRGIDVAIISKLPLVGSPIAHKVNFAGDSDECGATRDIVEATFALPNGDPLTVLGVHLPSQGNPQECRIRVFQQLSDISAGKGPGALVLTAGDFNFDCTELTSALYDRLTQRGNWYLSPVITASCNAPGSSKFLDGLTSWNTWSYLDQILVSPGLSATQPSVMNWFADLGSFQTVVVHAQQIMVDKQDKGFVEPRRFDPKTGLGVTDHWPVLVRLLNRRGS
ncbi:endonuclease/exonuclease/phosphatase family protein [Devosia sp. CN2-171]|uniref:endonuclease/exonuclease/phosphatase family protein n=1 Tax=Devosia sp. CN2-171 TaxID=3400909 RepID=UPI003BF8B727